MKATLTFKIKLGVTEQASQSLSEAEKAYAVALNHTSQVAFEKQAFNSVALHHITYRDVREMTKLPANLVCSARIIVTAPRSSIRRAQEPKPKTAFETDGGQREEVG